MNEFVEAFNRFKVLYEAPHVARVKLSRKEAFKASLGKWHKDGPPDQFGPCAMCEYQNSCGGCPLPFKGDPCDDSSGDVLHPWFEWSYQGGRDDTAHAEKMYRFILRRYVSELVEMQRDEPTHVDIDVFDNVYGVAFNLGKEGDDL